ncbi:MAG TPA: DUF2971 domain-containing protein [Elusimicrobiales bacterium]|nr:DUF2971 domain-containing protein [Elusimicrobiales bacterium]
MKTLGSRDINNKIQQLMLRSGVKKPQIAYHYTTNKAFHDIVENGYFRLSNVRASNDYMEREWLYREILPRVIRARKSASDRKQLQQLERVSQSYSKSRRLYISAFSSIKDALGQWRGYADGGHGVALGINFSKAPVGIPSSAKMDWPSESFAPILYKSEQQLEIVEYVADQYLKAVKAASDMGAVMHLTMAYASRIESLAFICKNEAFGEEQEFRVMFDVWNGSRYLKHVNFEASQERLRMFYQIKFEKTDLREVILGPKNSSDTSEVEMFLEKNGYKNAKVSLSKVSYR